MNVPHFDVKSPRKLKLELEKQIDQKCLELFKEEFESALSKKDGNKLCSLCANAMNALRIREHGGNNRGKLVGLIQAVIGAFFPKGDGQAWCMSFVQTCIAYAEVKTGIVSKVYASESCASVRQKSPVSLNVKGEASKEGDVWVWMYTSGSRSGLGHTGIFINWTNAQYISGARLIEGNTESGLVDGKVNRDGGGVYITLRPFLIKGMKLAAVLRPFP